MDRATRNRARLVHALRSHDDLSVDKRTNKGNYSWNRSQRTVQTKFGEKCEFVAPLRLELLLCNQQSNGNGEV